MENVRTVPIKEEIKSRWWYRLSKIFFWLIISLTIFAGFYRAGINLGGLLDATVGALLNAAILYGLWKIVIYVAFGTSKAEKEDLELKITKNEKVNTYTDDEFVSIACGIFTLIISLTILITYNF